MTGRIGVCLSAAKRRGSTAAHGARGRYLELQRRLARAALGSSSPDRDGGAGDLDLGSVGAEVYDEFAGSPEILTLVDGDDGG